MKLIVGLGNPGFRYEKTRHNAGFWVVDELAQRLDVKPNRRAHEAFVAGGRLENSLIVLAKPQTFMNLSGRSVAALLRYYKVDPASLLIIYDELELVPGRLRLRGSGSAGGHNGMKSIIAALGTQEIPRLRVGIGRPPEHIPTADYVLRPPVTVEEPLLAAAVKRAADCAIHWVQHGLAAAMNECNS